MGASVAPGTAAARIMLFVGGPCTEGAGKVISRDLTEEIRSHKDLAKDAAVHFRKAKKYYDGLAQVCWTLNLMTDSSRAYPPLCDDSMSNVVCCSQLDHYEAIAASPPRGTTTACNLTLFASMLHQCSRGDLCRSSHL